MTETRSQAHTSPDQVASSARDPIDRWLDVFVRLLRVPRADAQRIRDELEDHLRARVDDLMVTGQPEPEAVRIAVAELGETAELARDFAAARTSPRRRMLMQATVLAATGIAIVTGSTALLSVSSIPSSSQQAIAQNDAESPAEAPTAGEAEPITFKRDLVAPDAATREVAVRGAGRGVQVPAMPTVADALDLLEETVGRRVVLPAAGVSPHGGPVSTDVPIRPLALTGLSLDQGVRMIGAELGGGMMNDPFVLNETETALELAPQSYFDRRDAVLIEYDISSLLTPPEGDTIDPSAFAGTVESLVEPQLWGDTAHLGMISTTMLVNAHPRVHAKIDDLIARIQARHAQQRETKRADREATLTTNIARFTREIEGYEQTIARITSELDEARATRRTARELVFKLENQMQRARGDDQIPFRLDHADATDALSSANRQVADLGNRLVKMEQSLAISRAQLKSSESELSDIESAASRRDSAKGADTALGSIVNGDIITVR